MMLRVIEDMMVVGDQTNFLNLRHDAIFLGNDPHDEASHRFAQRQVLFFILRNNTT